MTGACLQQPCSNQTKFEGDISVASTGLVHTDFDVNGVRLQNLGDPNTFGQGLAFGVVATDTGGAVVFSWPSEYDACHSFMDTLLQRGVDELPSLVVQFMFAYVENTYFSHEWWHALPESAQKHIMRLARNTIQYGDPVDFSGDNFVGWTGVTVKTM
jgi:hypothetical protein